MIRPLPESDATTLGFELSGRLHDEDYKGFVPKIEEAVKAHGKINLLTHFHDFEGWDAHALWDDTVFATEYCTKVNRIALVGEKTWEEWMAKVCKPFTMAQIRYFDAPQLADAWKWAEGESAGV